MELSMVKQIVIGSVVPPLHPVFEACCHKYFDTAPLWIEPGLHLGLKLAIENPSEVGADRIANCVGALEMCGAPAIAVDLGTATTFDIVNERQEYIGGMILPGIKIAAEALFIRAAKLPRVEIAKPDKLIGRNTVQAMQSGLFYGCVGQIDGILERLCQQLPSAAVVATGGLTKTIGKESRFIQRVEPDLTLNGLRSLWFLNRGN
jgi:type III pantothenate kinase